MVLLHLFHNQGKGQPIGGKSYIQKVLTTAPNDLILYHPMNEASGAVAIDYSAEGNDGAYTGVDLGQTGVGDGNTCPYFDGANDYNNMYSAGLVADFDKAEGTIACWFKVSGVGIWTDSSDRYGFYIYASINNTLWIGRSAANNTLQYFYKAGGTSNIVNSAGHSETGWFHAALTWSVGDDEVKAYFNGSQVGSTLTGLGTWAGDPASDKTNIGCADNDSGPTNVWDGWLAHAPIWKIALSAPQIARLAVV